MKFTGQERKMYILALGLLVAAIALACTWTMWERPSSQASLSAETPTPAPSETPMAEETPAAEETPLSEGTATPEEGAEADDAGTVDTVVYYQDNYGYLVPVRNPAALAAGMERFIVNPELIVVMGETSRKLAETQYDARLVAAALLKLIL